MLRLVGRALAAGLLLVAGASQAQVVISQVYGGGGAAAATYNRDYVELFNRGSAPVSLSGLSLQYASGTGTGNFAVGATLPNVSLAPGRYYLVGMASGAGVNALPTPDATGTSNMSATAGKVVLANTTASLGCNGASAPCSAAQQALIVDLVGFGGANFFEGAAPTAAPSTANAALRKANGCTDTNDNGADFAVAAAAPRNGATAASPCGATSAVLAVADATDFEGDSGTKTFVFGFGLSQPAGPGGVSIAWNTADGTATAGSDYAAASGTLAIAEGATSGTVAITVNGDTTSEPDETFFVRATSATGATISDGEGLGTIQNDDVTVAAIHDVQGNGAASPLAGAIVTVEGIVTARKFNNGFFLQAPDAEADADPATSEGVFVFTSTAPTAAATVGNRVRVTGTVTEFTPSTNLNQLSITEIVSPTVQQLATAQPLPAPVALTAAVFGPGASPTAAERYEGMRVGVAAGRVVAASNGNIDENDANSTTDGVFHMVLDGVARPFREPGIGALDVIPIPAGKNPPRFDTNQERIMVRSRGQVGATALTVDAGATVTGMAGVLDYFGGAWALLPDAGSGAVAGGKAPAAVADAAYEDVTIGGFNLLRFFDEVNDSNGGVTLTAAALDKRLTKTGAAICDWLKAPDILGVVEVENLRVMGLLADRINATCPRAPAYVPYLVDGNDVGGINVGFFVSARAIGASPRVQVLEVAQYGKATTFSNPNGTTSLLNDRPPLLLRAVVRQDNGASYPVTAIVNHLRSLNGIDDTAAGTNGWATEGDRVRAKRAAQAVFLAQLTQSLHQANPAERIVLLGDFNAFEFNDGYTDVMGIVRGAPAAADQVLTYAASPLVDDGYIDGASAVSDPAERYSYVFDGNAQTLDHVLFNPALALSASALAVDHARINADFGVHHYGETGNALRVSDHDPVRLRLSLADFRTSDLSMAATAAPASVPAGGTATFTARLSNAGPNPTAGATSVALVFNALVAPSTTASAGWTCAAPTQDATTTTVVCGTSQPQAVGTNVASFTATVAAPSLPAASVLRMAASVQAQIRDRSNADNSASAEVAVQAVALPSADLALRMVGGPYGTLRAGYASSFSVQVRNAGPTATTQATVDFTGDVPLNNAAVVPPAGWTCARNAVSGGFRIVCTLGGTFAVNGKANFGFSAVAPPPSVQGTMTLGTNVASTAVSDPIANNNAATYSVTIVP